MSENFIFQDYLDNLNLCDELIEHFKNGKKVEGKVNHAINGLVVDKEVKDSLDCCLTPEDDITYRYLNELQKISNKYIEKYPFANYYSPWEIVSPINLQYYKPGAGYKIWHTERVSNEGINSGRHLVFMTYLNDVTDAGETEFYHQKVKFQPKKGLTLIWPADWTYTHRGIVSPTQEKYIITGWFNYVERKKLVAFL